LKKKIGSELDDHFMQVRCYDESMLL